MRELLKDRSKLTDLLYIARALIVRSDQRGYDILASITDLLSSPQVGPIAGRCIVLVTDDTDSALSKDNFAVVKVSSIARSIV